ncbi:cytochrome P450 71A1-like isoform X1 [Gastrolobium bilobum]|uniref:cytochrome P450 71A1-like isoform X1 n=1 Tax=Gastrolobium bilobum TaxID=150636 RepID=UPI002AAF39EF|nr:cytochrome P450 71A1-like isoform X1 [Gastrolobium bilobum]
MGVLVLLSLLSILTLFIIHKHRTNRARALLPPGPPGLPLIGNLHQLDNSAPHRSLSQLSKRYGPLMSLRLGSVPTLVVSSAKMATQVLKTHDLIFASRPSFLGPRILSYNFLDLGFTPYSPYWREMKKLSILHLFSSHRVQSFRPIREDEVAQMIQKLSEYDASHKVVNLTEILMSFTCTSISRIAFGKKYSYEYDEVVELGSHRRSRLQVLLNEAQAMMTEFYFSDYFPLMGWVDRVRGILWRLDKTFKELDVFYERVIHDHMDPTRHKTNDQDVTDIIDIFLQMINDHSFSFDLTLDHIKAVLMNIFTAGTDPSSAAIVWAMTALLRNPDVMKKVQGEIRDLFGDKDFVNEDDIERLPYLKAVVKETLRLFPPSPLLLPRETMERCTIDGYEIQAKTLVYVNAWAIARDPENWEDPEKFYPERFLGSSIDLKGKDFEVIPFGAGRRMCPAKHMAVVTVELSLANLLHSFDWEVPRGFDKDDVLDTQVKPGITMHKKNDLYLVAKKHSTISII